ncbi:MAG: single-stranded DNA-binding protein [Alistipes sp.]|nr:single-stranded DNA-binding protein [Alistipes sp.]
MVNKVILIGNVGADPEVRTTESGVKVARVRLATTERLFDRQANETREHTEWHTITLWRGLADVVDRYVRKGSQIYIEGRLRTRDWMDKDNNRRYTTEILADSMNLLGRRGDAPASEGASYGQAPTASAAPAASAGYAAPRPAAAPAAPAPGYASQAAPTPAQPAAPQAPAMPADDPDDLPF